MDNYEAGEPIASESNDAAGGGWRELMLPQYAATTAMLCLGVALYAFNSFLVSTALPSAVEELGGARLISWSLSLFLTASIVAGSAAPLLKRRVGARMALISTALVFVVGTIVAGSANSMATILFGRVLQGVGEGVVAAICYTLIPVMFPSRLVPKVFGAEAVIWGVAAFGGPALAGFLTESISWRAAFYVNIPAAAIFIALVLFIVPRNVGESVKSVFPARRLALLSASLLIAMSAGLAPSLPLSLGILMIGALALAGSLRIDRASPQSLLPQGAFSLRSPLGLGLLVVVMMPVAQATSAVYLVFSLQNLWGMSATLAGAISALMAICWSGAAILIANLRGRQRQQSTIWIGPVLQAFGFAALFLGIATQELAFILIGQILTGCSYGVSWGFLSQTMMEVTPVADRDKTSAMLPTLQSAGYAFGGAFAGLAANAAGLTNSHTAEILHWPLTVTFLYALVTTVPGIFAARRAVTLLRANAAGSRP